MVLVSRLNIGICWISRKSENKFLKKCNDAGRYVLVDDKTFFTTGSR
jgi:hypothetical protein